MYTAHCDPLLSWYVFRAAMAALTSVAQVVTAVEVVAAVAAMEAAASCTSWEAPSSTSSWGWVRCQVEFI